MALTPAVIDVSLSTMNQTPSDTMGPMGRLQDLVNCVVKRYLPHYTGTQGVVPAKIRVEPRDGFASLPATARSVVDGSPATLAWDRQRMLAELDSQLVSICGGSLPRVFDGANWRAYPNNAVLTQRLAQEVLHTSQHTIQAPDSAWMSGVTCAVWTETQVTSTGAITTSYVGFRADNGAWLVQPAVLFASTATTFLAQARVVTDGTHFFVFFGVDATHVDINCYDATGARLAQSGVAVASSRSMAWDVTAAVTGAPHAGTVILASAISTSADSGVLLTSVGFATGSITTNPLPDVGIKCAGTVAFITNDTGNGLSYLATVDSAADVWAYEIQALAHVHEFGDFLTIGTDANTLDSLAGFAVAGGDGIDVVLSIGLLPNLTTPAASGPKVDPAFRYITVFKCDRSNARTFMRTTQSLAQTSRAFVIDGNYYSIGYYQSGSGSVLVQTKETVSITGGDFMIGAATQPVAVQSGDWTQGSIINATANGVTGPAVHVTDTHAAVAPASGDFVNVTTVPSGLPGVPAGTFVLAWKLANLGSTTNQIGSRLVVSGTSVAAANFTFDVIGIDSAGRFLTPITAVNGVNAGSPIASGNFTAGVGTVALTSMTAYVVNDLSPFIGDDTERFFIGAITQGFVTVTGASIGGNNITGNPIQRIQHGSTLYFGSSSGPWGAVWVLTTSQSTHIDNGFKAAISPATPNQWVFANGDFDATYVGTDLVVDTNTLVAPNTGTFPITSVGAATEFVTGDATSLIAQIFEIPLPTVSIQLTTQVPYTFKLQSITPDYTYQNALVLVQGAANPANNGTYRIYQINADGTFVALPTNGLSNQVNEAFVNGAQTITIFFAPSNEPPFQSTWFVVPMTGQQPVAGRFEYGLAYADWRIEGDQTAGPDLFPCASPSVYTTPVGTQFVLPYRAENITSSVTQITAAGDVDVGDVAFDSTVGLKQFWLETGTGQAYANSGELLIPGPMATVFTASGFAEDNINLAPEAPFLVSQSVASSGQLGLTLGSIRIYVVVWEATDENGNRIYSSPSPPLTVNMSGTNNVALIGGRVIFPLAGTGVPFGDSTFGPTCRNVTLSIYARAFINGVPTTQRYKITSDLAANARAPISATNPSGFSFPDSFTWNYLDQNPDSEIQTGEILYTNKGYLPRVPAPAFSAGVSSWQNREWVLGYDGAIWFSGEKTEGDAIWFNPAFRIVLPSDDEPLGIASMENYLIVTCASSVWYIPAVQLPDATGANGTIPTPVRLPFPNGTIRGLTQTLRDGVAYDSTAGGVWMITRSLENVWLSHDVQDTLAAPIVDLALDSQQRLFVLQETGPIMVYDGIPAAWYAWNVPTTGVLLSSYQGQVAYQDAATVNALVPGAVVDTIAGTPSGIAPDITIAPLNLGNVRGLKRVWEFQAVGTYLGPHRVNVVLSYPEDDWPDTAYEPFVPGASDPYVIPFNPDFEEASQYGIRIYADFVGIGSPGATFALEMVSAQVGADESVGLNKRPESKTMISGS